MNVYFARSIRGVRQDGAKYINEAILKAIKIAGHTPALELTPNIVRENNTERYIYLRDLSWIDRSQACIAEVSSPSHGVGYEIAYAQHVAQIPILCLATEGTHVSAMLAGNLDIVYYRDSIQLHDSILSFLDKLTTPTR